MNQWKIDTQALDIGLRYQISKYQSTLTSSAEGILRGKTQNQKVKHMGTKEDNLSICRAQLTTLTVVANDPDAYNEIGPLIRQELERYVWVSDRPGAAMDILHLQNF